MSGEQWIVNSDSKLGGFLAHAAELYRQHKYVSFKWTTGQQRSSQQQKAIEVYCRELADTLNKSGLDQRKVMDFMREGVEIPWTQSSVKEALWRTVQIASIGKKSTADLHRDEVCKVYDILNRWTSEKIGVSVIFPSEDDK
jgi:hypothetical protein